MRYSKEMTCCEQNADDKKDETMPNMAEQCVPDSMVSSPMIYELKNELPN
jgi:hypothetical protein